MLLSDDGGSSEQCTQDSSGDIQAGISCVLENYSRRRGVKCLAPNVGNSVLTEGNYAVFKWNENMQ